MKPLVPKVPDPRVGDGRAPLRRPSVLTATIQPTRSVAVRQIRVVIATDHALERDGLRALLRAEADFVVIGEAHDAKSALVLVQELTPDVLLLDASLIQDPGIDLLRQLQSLGSAVQTILLTASIDREDVLAVLQAGVRGIVSKQTPTHLLFRSIRHVRTGEVWITRDVVSDLVNALAGMRQITQAVPQRDFGLTPREREVLALIVEGETNKGIATRLVIGADTVKHHLTSIFNKTGASNRLELALFALHHNLVQPTRA